MGYKKNGPTRADDINLVKPGFNSEYVPIHDLWAHKIDPRSDVSVWTLFAHTALAGFDGRGNYSSPEFTWMGSV